MLINQTSSRGFHPLPLHHTWRLSRRAQPTSYVQLSSIRFQAESTGLIQLLRRLAPYWKGLLEGETWYPASGTPPFLRQSQELPVFCMMVCSLTVIVIQQVCLALLRSYNQTLDADGSQGLSS